MSKFVRVMDGLKSNASGEEFKLDQVIEASVWNPDEVEPEKMGGFNFTTEDKILRYIFRGDTIYDVIVPEDAEVKVCDSKNAPKSIYRANKIIVTNPRSVTEDMVIDFYKKTDLPIKTLFQCIYCLLFKGYINASKYIIKDIVTMDNIDDAIKEFEDFAVRSKDNDIGVFDYNKLFDDAKEIYDILQEIKSDVDINLYIDKEPYVKVISDDKIINLTGQSGSGKSTYASEHFNSDEYVIVDTDNIFSEKRYEKAEGLDKELGTYFRNKYQELPTTGDNFDLIYKEILDYCKDIDKTIVIDSAQFHCLKDISILKGTLIVIRTSISNCYDRTITRYIKNFPNYTEEELDKFKEKKKPIFVWYKGSNAFLEKVDKEL